MCERVGASGTFKILSEASHVAQRTISRTLNEDHIKMALPEGKSGLSRCFKAAQTMITIELVCTSKAIFTYGHYRWQWELRGNKLVSMLSAHVICDSRLMHAEPVHQVVISSGSAISHACGRQNMGCMQPQD